MTEKILRKLIHPSIFFILGQTAAGGLNYLYQVYMTRVLAPVPFGEWSVWFAQFSFTLLVALWVQTLCTLDGPGQKKFAFLSLPTFKWVAVGGLSLLSLVALALGDMRLFNAVGWGWAVLQSLYYGRSLAREELRRLAIAMFAGSLFKFALPILFPTELACYLGVLFGPLAAVYGLAFFENRKNEAAAREPAPSSRWSLMTLGCALMLAIGTAWVPQMDLLMANQLLDAENMGLFAKVALVYKAFFFFILILAQLLLSKQVQSPKAQFGLVKLLVVPAGGVLMALLCFGFFPETLAPSRWVGFSILHIATLTYLFLLLQTFVSATRWKPALVILGTLLAEALAVRLGGLGLFTGLEIYFTAVIVIEALLGASFVVLNLRRA